MNDASSNPPESSPPPPQGAGVATAVKLLTWWRCGGCVMVILVISVGILLGVFSMVSSQFFAVEPLVSPEAPVADRIVFREGVVNRIQNATSRGEPIELQATELNAAILHWFEQSGLAGAQSGIECSYETPGRLRVQLAYEVPSGLGFPAGLLEGRFFNADLTVSGTLDPSDPTQLLIHRYLLGTGKEVTEPEPGTTGVLADTLGRFLRYHPDLLQALGKIKKVTIGPQRVRLELHRE